ncbi:MAG: hypothetical protein QXO70_04510, partial [Candidatus Pacearchaeota archaeon]
MGFVDITRPISGKENNTEFEKLNQYASNLGINLPQPKEKKIGILGTLNKISEIANTGAFISGEILNKIIGSKIDTKETAYKGKILPSEAIFGIDKRKANSIWEGIKNNFFSTEGLLRLGTDIVFDPITYITLGTGSAVKVVSSGGKTVLLSKAGKELVKELAEEVGEKGAKQVVADLTTSERLTSLLARGGLENIKRGLEKVGRKFNVKNVNEVLESGIKELRASGGLKFMGKTIIPEN